MCGSFRWMAVRAYPQKSVNGMVIRGDDGRVTRWWWRPRITVKKTEHRFPSSRNTRTIERFTRVDENMIDYQCTINDPTTYTKPRTAIRPMLKLNDYQIYEYAWHEGNYAITNILRGARIQEMAAAQRLNEDGR